MNEVIENRELITLDGAGVILHGTYHKPQDRTTSSRQNSGKQNRIGVVFMNSLFLPRTATGDSAVYWAESFSKLGYHSFRLDLPGLGDSDAPLNTTLLDFINAGGYASVISAMVKELVERFELSGVVIFGHCAGAVSALYGAAASKECHGVILLDPYFHLPQQMKESKLWKQLVRWAARSNLGGALSNIYDRLKNVRLALRGNAPPPDANFALLRRWEEVAARGLPILLLKAPSRKATGTKPRAGEFDYLKYLLELAKHRTQVVVRVIESTDHSFANRAGRAAVRQHGEHWLSTCFPLIKLVESVPDASASEASKSSASHMDHIPCF